jgi:hypothetical protein
LSRIPAVAHFVWNGPRLLPVAWLSMRAALERAGFDSVQLHHEDPLDACPLAADLKARGVQLRPVDGAALLESLDLPSGDCRRLADLFRRLREPAGRANLVRLAVLHQQGGVYLDTDAVARRDLRALLDVPGFAGLEHVALPVATLDSRRPGPWLRAGMLLGVREVLARTDRGEALFPKVAGAFALAVNNAVLGARAGHPTIDACLRTAAMLPDAVAMQRYRLGTKLLETVTQNRSTSQFVLHPPEAFYPFGPEMSWHLFRERAPAEVEAGLPAATSIVHLYDSVLRRRTGQSLDGAWLRAHRETTVVGALCGQWADALVALESAA